MGGSACHDDAHGAFMTVPPYTRTREGETRQLGGVVRGGPLRYEMFSKRTELKKVPEEEEKWSCTGCHVARHCLKMHLFVSCVAAL